MALAERLSNDTSIFLKNTRNWVNKNVLYKAMQFKMSGG